MNSEASDHGQPGEHTQPPSLGGTLVNATDQTSGARRMMHR